MDAARRTVLIIDYSFDWAPLWKPLSKEYRVEQTEWRLLDLCWVGTEGRLSATIEPSENPFPFTNQAQHRTIERVDAVLVRNFPTELRGRDFKAQVLALVVASGASAVVCVNNPVSLLATLERPWLYAELLRVASTLSGFHVVPLDYFPNTKGAGSRPRAHAPCVVKVGSCNAGFGKARVVSEEQRADLWSVLACSPHYVTEEPFVEHSFEYRVQVIGDHVRCFKRNSDSSWKNNTGNVSFSHMDVEPKHEAWSRACAQMLGGLDVFALDVLRAHDGTDTILEINPSANGLMWEVEEEDAKRIRDVVVAKLKHR